MTARLPSPEHVARLVGASRPRAGRLRKIAVLVALVALAASAGLAVLARGRGPKGPRYETARAARGDVRVTVTATGTLQAWGAVDVGSEISGRVQQVLVDYNDRVTRGQVLAEIDPVQLRADAAQASAQVAAAAAAIEQAQATREEARLAFERATAQQRLGLASDRDVEAARASFLRAEAQVASSQANAQLSRASAGSAAWKLTKARILSPIDGVVLTRSVEPGQTVVAALQAPVLFRLAADLSRLTLRVPVDEADVGRIREGNAAEFRVDAYAERAFASRVESIRNEPTTSQNVVTYEGVLAADNAERLLRPGMTATATIVADVRSNVLLVPNAALRFAPREPGGGGPGGPPGGAPRPAVQAPAKGMKRLYVLRDGALGSVDVRPGASDGRVTEVLEVAGGELPEGSEVVTDALGGG